MEGEQARATRRTLMARAMWSGILRMLLLRHEDVRYSGVATFTP